MKRLAICLTAVVAAAAAGGCGAAGERDAVRASAERFYAAVEEGDGAAACAQLSGQTAQALAQQARAPCRSAVLDLRVGRGGVASVTVAITSAEVRLADGEAAFLDRARHGWLLTAVGCRFDQGAPQRVPADCEADS